jgi:hypothetical protein
MHTMHTESRFAAKPHLESGLKIQLVARATEQGGGGTYYVNKCKQLPLTPLPPKPSQTVNKAGAGVEACKALTPQPEVRLVSP